MALANENNTRMVTIPIGTHIAAATETLAGYHSKGRATVKSVTLINEAALSGDDTNNRIVALRKKGGNDVATITTDVASGGLVATTGKDMTLSATAADLELADNGDLEIDLDVNGTGGALTGALLQLELIDRGGD